eukprot:TRINITY_DN8682_c0_g1_i1.p1 TRINITY_DN8682_c0_g1~~TRINITY_DN8682_c0_g1_i1.p1  ORF type:complete len:437 (-),score=29.35 TRINITY_DN8682_c0_g1_i1:258-1514(-)
MDTPKGLLVAAEAQNSYTEIMLPARAIQRGEPTTCTCLRRPTLSLRSHWCLREQTLQEVVPAASIAIKGTTAVNVWENMSRVVDTGPSSGHSPTSYCISASTDNASAALCALAASWDEAATVRPRRIRRDFPSRADHFWTDWSSDVSRSSSVQTVCVEMCPSSRGTTPSSFSSGANSRQLRVVEPVPQRAWVLRSLKTPRSASSNFWPSPCNSASDTEFIAGPSKSVLGCFIVRPSAPVPASPSFTDLSAVSAIGDPFLKRSVDDPFLIRSVDDPFLIRSARRGITRSCDACFFSSSVAFGDDSMLTPKKISTDVSETDLELELASIDTVAVDCLAVNANVEETFNPYFEVPSSSEPSCQVSRYATAGSSFPVPLRQPLDPLCSPKEDSIGRAKSMDLQVVQQYREGHLPAWVRGLGA